MLDLTAQGEGGGVKPSRQLLGKKLLGREGNGVHTRRRAHAELVALGLTSKCDPLGPSSLGQWLYASRVARSCSCWCLTSVITPEYLGALEKVAPCMHALTDASLEAEVIGTLLQAASRDHSTLHPPILLWQVGQFPGEGEWLAHPRPGAQCRKML